MKQHIDGEGFQLELETRRHHLHAYVHGGADSFDVSLSYWTLLGEACRQVGARRLLVVEDLTPWHASEEDFQRLMEAMRRSGLDQVQVAYTSLQTPIDVNEVGVIVGMEQGMWTRLFSTERDAELWLGVGSVPDER
ncbi:MAG TPA: hypothetical protein VGC43_03365 [Luteimonas sp.]